ncbi:PQQ-binding-like beta-propeller repeat protein [Streptomyces sp. NPDC051567]|uniref:outer membrane protein assembly factor BamB family protein n=1 Tax=Streptomyces sp. NPDC051567 TaxID=3365660 RepID=UPI003793DF5A
MSTPPPPHQPPPGGFGTTPSPYGSPPSADPPAPPGFGPLQDPPPGGFGAPPPYGPPTTPLHGPPAAPPPGGSARTQLAIVGAALLAVVLIIGTGLWYVSDQDTAAARPTADGAPTTPDGDRPQGPGGDEKAPADPRSRKLADVPLPQPEELVSVRGSWLTASAYVKSDVARIVGYGLADGARKWELPLPAQICGATAHISDNRTAVLLHDALPTAGRKYPRCTKVAVIDLTTGKLVWSATARSATGGDTDITFTEVTLSGRTVAAGGLSGGAAWDLADGTPRWQPKVDAEGCRDTGYAGGETLAVLRTCGQSSRPTLYAQVLDPVTGAPVSSYKLSQGIERAGIISTEPLVVAANVGGTAKNATNVSDLFVVDDTGALKARIPLASGNYAPKCPATEVEQCVNMVVGNGKVYLPSYEHQGKNPVGRTNELLSFDLNTGKQTTDRADAGEGYTLYPLRMDGPDIIAYKVAPYDKGGQVVRIDGTTMKETLLMENPARQESRRAEAAFAPERSEYRYHDGRLFIARTGARKPYSDTGDPEYLFVSFTTHR